MVPPIFVERMFVVKISKVRGSFYKSAKFLGDVSAVKNGTVAKRLTRRVAGRYTGKSLGKLFR